MIEVIGDLTLGETLQVLCARARISRAELARLVAVSPGALFNYLGDVTVPSASRLRKMTEVLALALGADPQQLWIALGHVIAGPTPASDASVLLVDDDERFRASLALLLGEQGFRVAGQASSGAEALDLLRRLPVDVVLMDLRMPGIDGVEAARRIKQIRPSTKVIALSAYDDTGLRLAVEASGMDGYLLKGTSPGLIREALQRSRPGTRRSASRVR